jgi:HAD superfamily hydrolase (TIGR01509 family)
MKIKAILFDFAGTLAYLKKPSQTSFFKSLEDFGFSIKSKEEMERFYSLLAALIGETKNWLDFSRQISNKFIKKPEAKKLKALSEFFKKTLTFSLYSDVEEIFSLPCRKAIFSNAPRFMIENMHLKDFDIFTPTETKFLKPDSRAFLFVLKKIKLAPEEVLMIGDTLEKDIAPALRLGMDAVLIDREDKIETLSKKINRLGQIKTILGL